MNTFCSLQKYRDQYPSGRFVAEATTRQQTLLGDDSPFLTAQQQGTEEALKRFLSDYPGHRRTADAQEALAKLRDEKTSKVTRETKPVIDTVDNAHRTTSSVDTRAINSSSQVLWDAAIRGDAIRVSQILVDCPQCINARDGSGMTALHYAAYKGHKKVAEVLLAKGADINAKESMGLTPSDFAKGEVVELLRQWRQRRNTILK